jgi:hypothetical protein
MERAVELQCRCGQVAGRLARAAPETVNRVICYCADCQAFLHHLGRADWLDAQGGSDIVQVAPSALSFQRGAERIEAVRLSPRGLYRWYASCCKTPVGNTVSPGIPFVGIGVHVFDGGLAGADEVFGKPRAAIYGQYAIGSPPPGSTKPPVALIVRSLGLILGWRLRGMTWPHPFFDRASREPKLPVKILSRDEREALRAVCGPRPSAAHAA